MKTTTAKEQVSKISAYMNITKNLYFMAPWLMTTEIEYTDKIPLLATDGKKIYINPDQFTTLKSPKHRLFGIAHEISHIMLKHCTPLSNKGYNLRLANIAKDCVINALLIKSNIGLPIKEGIVPDRSDNTTIKINGKSCIIKEASTRSWQYVYMELLKHIKDNPSKGKGNSESTTETIEIESENEGFDEHIEKELAPEEEKEIDRKIEEGQVREEIQRSKNRGSMPGAFYNVMAKLVRPKINWLSLIRDAIYPKINSWDTFSRTNRRNEAYDDGIIMPGYEQDGADVLIAIDTSGSMSIKEISYIISELLSMFTMFPSGSLTMKVFLHDVTVYAEYCFNSGEEFNITEIRTGGTDHHEVFLKAEEENAQLLICFTDGASSFPDSTTIRDVLWILTNEAANIPDNLGRVKYVPIEDIRGE